MFFQLSVGICFIAASWADLPFLSTSSADDARSTALVPGVLISSPSGYIYRLKEEVLSCAATIPVELEGAVTLTDTTCVVPHADSLGDPYNAVERRTPERGDASVLSASSQDDILRRRSYNLGAQLGKGAQGQVWRAQRIGPGNVIEGGDYIVKRMFATRPGALQSGWREAWFGASLRGQPYVARYVEHFLRTSPDPSAASEELWLVFEDEGVSLQALLYTTSPLNSGSLLSAAATLLPGPFWLRLVTEPEGPPVFLTILRQLLHGARDLHRASVLHRDIKPANMLLSFRGGALRLRLADFGSAVDDDALARLYPDSGPSLDDETLAYAPPEARVDRIPYIESERGSYDVFSIGVVALELLLGVPAAQILTPTDRDMALFAQRHPDASPAEAESELLRLGLLRFCISPDVKPPMPPDDGITEDAESRADSGPAGEECSRAGFLRAMRAAQAAAACRAEEEIARRDAAQMTQELVLRQQQFSMEEPLRDQREGRWLVSDSAAFVASTATAAFEGVVPRPEGEELLHAAQDRAPSWELTSAGEAPAAPLALARRWGEPPPLDAHGAAAALQLTDRLFEAAPAGARVTPPLELQLPWSGSGLGGASDPLAQRQAAPESGDATDGLPSPSQPHNPHHTRRRTSQSRSLCDPSGWDLDSPSPLLGSAGEDLLWRLLLWDPLLRIRADQALHHPFIHPAHA